MVAAKVAVLRALSFLAKDLIFAEIADSNTIPTQEALQ
jgi:hypothetical protein